MAADTDAHGSGQHPTAAQLLELLTSCAAEGQRSSERVPMRRGVKAICCFVRMSRRGAW